MMGHERTFPRRAFLGMGVTGAAGLLAVGCQGVKAGGPASAMDEPEEEEVTPGEDLMREHGLLIRALLVYRETSRRLTANKELPVEAFGETVTLVRHFVEDYHEKMEEDHVFPRFRKAGRLVDLVDTLKTQHDAGRRLTDRTLALTGPAFPANDAARRELASLLEAYERMYLPHLAREDTVLFVALKEIVPPEEYEEMGERFEEIEHRVVGEEGFENAVRKIATIERMFDIEDLGRFTPKG